MMVLFIYLCGLAASLVGAYFIAYQVMRRVLREKISQLKLLGFLVAFAAGFFAIFIPVSWVIANNIGFGR